MKKIATGLLALAISASTFAGVDQQRQSAQIADMIPGWTDGATAGTSHWDQFVNRCLNEGTGAFGAQYDTNKIKVACEKQWYKHKKVKVHHGQKANDGIFKSYSAYNLTGPKGQSIDVQPEMTMDKLQSALTNYELEKLVLYKYKKVWGYDDVDCDMIKDAFGQGSASQAQAQSEGQAQDQAQTASVDTSREAFCEYLEGYLEDRGESVPVERTKDGDSFFPNQVLDITGPNIL